MGWKRAGEECVQLQFVPTRRAQAEAECQRLGAQLVDILDGAGELEAPLIEDISDILEAIFSLIRDSIIIRLS